MIQTKFIIIILIITAGVVVFSYPVSAIPVKCDHCSEEYPCAAVFEFKNVKFVHQLFCEVDEDGREQWNSYDEEKLDMFYFEHPKTDDNERKLKI